VHHSNNRVFSGNDIHQDGHISVAHFVLHEWENHTLDAGRDLWSGGIPLDHVLVGHEEIYNHELMSRGIGSMLLALERQATQPVTG